MGSGYFIGNEAGIDLNLNFSVLGAVKGKDNLTTANFTMKVTGTASDGFQVVPATGSIKFNFTVDSTSTHLIGVAKGKFCLQGFGCQPIDAAADFVPPGAGGYWTLVLDIQAIDGKRLTGTASAVLANGRTLPFAVSVKYTSTSDVSKLKLTGNGSKLTLQGNAAPWGLRLRGRCQGFGIRAGWEPLCRQF